MLSRYSVACSRRARSSRSVSAPRIARSRINRERLAGWGSTAAIAAASSGSTVTWTRGCEEAIDDECTALVVHRLCEEKSDPGRGCPHGNLDAEPEADGA